MLVFQDVSVRECEVTRGSRLKIFTSTENIARCLLHPCLAITIVLLRQIKVSISCALCVALFQEHHTISSESTVQNKCQDTSYHIIILDLSPGVFANYIEIKADGIRKLTREK